MKPVLRTSLQIVEYRTAIVYSLFFDIDECALFPTLQGLFKGSGIKWFLLNTRVLIVQCPLGASNTILRIVHCSLCWMCLCNKFLRTLFPVVFPIHCSCYFQKWFIFQPSLWLMEVAILPCLYV